MAAKSYLIPVHEIKSSTVIDDNYDGNKILISIWEVQELVLEDILGTALYRKLLADNTAKTLSEDNQSLLTDYIWPVLEYGVLQNLYTDIWIRLTRSSMVKDNNDISSSISADEVFIIQKKTENKSLQFIDKLVDHLEAFSSKYPEYDGIQPLDGEGPDKTENSSIMWNYGLF